MDMGDVLDWLSWGVLALCFLLMVVVAVMALLAIVVNVVLFYCRRGRRRANSMFIEQLLRAIPDVPYHEELGGGGEEDDRESCVICITPYEAGETCAVLPPCTHMFHKACVAKWLHKKTTCPLCRAAVVPQLPSVPPSAQQRPQVNAADNMV